MSTGRTALPEYASAQLHSGERIHAVGRFHWVSVGMFIVMAPIILAVILFALLVEPGFIRLAVLPAIPLMVGLLQILLFGAGRILVTDGRVILARRLMPQSIALSELAAIDLREGLLGRRLGYGKIILMDERYAADPEEARFAARMMLGYVRGAREVADAILAAARSTGVGLEEFGRLAGDGEHHL